MGGTAMNTVLRRSIYIILFVVFLALIITGLKEQTLGYLFRMFAVFYGLVVLLWVYNKNHK